jgi:hypothetical protein
MTASLPIASNQELDSSADYDLLGLWIRERGFGRSLDRWWLAPVNHDGKFTPNSYYPIRARSRSAPLAAKSSKW